MGAPFAVEMPVRFRDVDMMGHVNNAVYLTYMETARTAYYLALAGKTVLPSAAEFDWIVARAEIDFRDAAVLGETVVATVWPSRLGSTSWDFAYRLVEKGSGRLLAEGLTVQVMYDYAAKKARPLPSPFRAQLEAAKRTAEQRGLSPSRR